MKLFTVALATVALTIVVTAFAGDLPARRYENDACQYNMAYLQNPSDDIGLLTLGGSRARVAMQAKHFNEILQDLRPDSLPVYNFAHSIYSLEKEYVLLRDIVSRRTPKAALIMIEPRQRDLGSSHPDFHTVAKLEDIPLALSTLWPESKIESLNAVRAILWEHLRFFERTEGKLHRQETKVDCDRFDFRLNVPVLERAFSRYEERKELESHVLKWDLTSSNQEGFLRWMRAYKELSQEYDFEIFFILMTGMADKLPPVDLETRFENATGMPLIAFDKNIHAAISPDGRRDGSHINKVGRDIFLPWLIGRIEDKCRSETGCL